MFDRDVVACENSLINRFGKQFRLLLSAIRRTLYEMAPEDRPRLVIFGESLGAHTSQDPFLHTGTQGLVDGGIDGALWSVTPHHQGGSCFSSQGPLRSGRRICHSMVPSLRQ